jgi:ubiquitin-protein ligase
MVIKFIAAVSAAWSTVLTTSVRVELEAPGLFGFGPAAAAGAGTAPAPTATAAQPNLAQTRLGNEWNKKYNTKKGKKWMATEGIHLQPLSEDLYLWEVRLTGFDPTTNFGRSAAEHGVDEVILHFQMDDQFPMKSPFARLIWPKVEGPFITSHGAMCQEVLNTQVTGMLIVIGQTLKAWFQQNENRILVGGIGNAVKGDDENWVADSKTVHGFVEDLARTDDRHYKQAHFGGSGYGTQKLLS